MTQAQFKEMFVTFFLGLDGESVFQPVISQNISRPYRNSGRRFSCRRYSFGHYNGLGHVGVLNEIAQKYLRQKRPYTGTDSPALIRSITTVVRYHRMRGLPSNRRWVRA